MANDSDPGVGVGTPVSPGVPGALPPAGEICYIVPTVGELRCDELLVPDHEYAHFIGYDECAFMGVTREDDNPPAGYADAHLWTKQERDMVRYYLSMAQSEVEMELKYPLFPRWIEDEEHDYEYPVMGNWRRVISVGVEGTTSISAGEAVSYATEPATVGPIATTVTDESEIRIYHPSSCAPIWPSNIVISGGTLTLEIPRCRLLTEAGESDTGGVNYSDTGAGSGLFEQTVDIVRVYNDDTTQGTLVWSHGTGNCPSCSGTTADACETLINGKTGEIDVQRATYSGGTWTRTPMDCYCHHPDRMRINYRAGLLACDEPQITSVLKSAVIRLAHARFPHDPCNVEPPMWMWTDDREIPRQITARRADNPFGVKNGEWFAYMKVKQFKIRRGYTL
jgi:hypothetical protein